MGVDHSNAFVRLSFDGLIAFCFNEKGACEMGMVQNDDHQPLLTITRINPGGSRTFIRRFELGPDDNVMIEAEDPQRAGTSTFPLELTGTFDPLSTDADPEDFRWIMDLQGANFHGDALKLKDDAGDDPTSDRLRPRILIPHGIFYAREKTPDTYARHPHVGTSEFKDIGKIADSVGADIVCDPIGGRVRVTVGKEQFTLAKHTAKSGKGFRYRLRITNLCRSEGPGPTCPPDESDFPLYYKVAVDRNGIQFDVRDKYVKGDPRGTKSFEEFAEALTGRKVELPADLARFRSNGPPQVCNLVFLSQTTRIP